MENSIFVEALWKKSPVNVIFLLEEIKKGR